MDRKKFRRGGKNGCGADIFQIRRIWRAAMERKYGEKKISAIVCIVIFFGVIAFSAGLDILEDHAVSGARKDLSFVTECGDNAVMTSYVLTDYEDDGTVVRNGPEGSHKMTFTCNVDWGEEVIPDILDILEEKDVKITFFVTGSWASKNPSLLRRMYLAGHEIGSHGYGHKMCSQISEDELRSEIEKTEAAISDAIGVKPVYFAPPSGDFSDKTVDFCRNEGYRMILWSADTIDWKEGSTASVIYDRIMKKETDGAIVLMHPKPETVKALPDLIDSIREQGTEPVSLSELLSSAASDAETETEETGER